jgi:CRP/FNR family transcriptional regulator, cyclic AMP receptor protein
MQLQDDEMRLFLEVARERRVAEGTELLAAQDTTDEVFVILQGTARVAVHSEDGRMIDFADTGPGELVGFIAAIDGGPRTASVIAREPMRIAMTDRKRFLALLDDRRFADAVMKSLIEQMRALSERVIEFSTLLVRERLLRELLRRARAEDPETCDEGGAVRLSPAPTHFDLAARISTHREAVSREMSGLAKRGILRREKGDLVVEAEALEIELDGRDV